VGISVNQLSYLISKREELYSKRIAVISVLYPPERKELLLALTRNRELVQKKEIEKLLQVSPGLFLKTLFTDIFACNCVDFFDISEEEGANRIVNLGIGLKSQKTIELDGLIHSYDLIIDGGTIEHIFDTKTYLENLIMLARVGGEVIISTPTNNYCNHGFYQFSPTFISDLVFNNRGKIKLLYLDISMSAVSCSMLGLQDYSHLDPSYVHNSSRNYSIDLGPLTGTFINLINRSGKKAVLEFALKVVDKGKLGFDIMQYEYQLNELKQICPPEKSSKFVFLDRNFFIRSLKELVLFVLTYFPLPLITKLQLFGRLSQSLALLVNGVKIR